jgi:hypothetical protein
VFLKLPRFQAKTACFRRFSHVWILRVFKISPRSFFQKSGVFPPKTSVFGDFSMIFPEKSGVALI